MSLESLSPAFLVHRIVIQLPPACCAYEYELFFFLCHDVQIHEGFAAAVIYELCRSVGAGINL